MNPPPSHPETYAERTLLALGDAITAVSTDATTRTVTYHRQDAARACIAMAAVMIHGEAEGAKPLTPAEVGALLAQTLGTSLTTLAAVLPKHVLDAEKPGFTTRTLA